MADAHLAEVGAVGRAFDAIIIGPAGEAEVLFPGLHLKHRGIVVAEMIISPLPQIRVRGRGDGDGVSVNLGTARFPCPVKLVQVHVPIICQCPCFWDTTISFGA